MQPLLVDIHSHVNFAAFREDGDLVLQRALEKNIWVFNIGSQFDTSKRAVEYAEKYEKGVYAIAGLHPIHLEEQEVDEEETRFKTKGEIFDRDAYLKLAQHPKVVGIGECGLDYFRIAPALTADNFFGAASKQPGALPPQKLPQFALEQEIKTRQREALIWQIALANEVGKPVMFHVRASKDDPEDAHFDLIEIIKKHPPKSGGDVHCFSGSKEVASKFLELGLHLSFTGIVTFRNAEALRDVVRYVPLDRMMVETDSPYLAPEPFRGKRCEPSYVEYTARKVAEVKGVTFEEVATKTTEKAMRLFKIEMQHMASAHTKVG